MRVSNLVASVLLVQACSMPSGSSAGSSPWITIDSARVLRFPDGYGRLLISGFFRNNSAARVELASCGSTAMPEFEIHERTTSGYVKLLHSPCLTVDPGPLYVDAGATYPLNLIMPLMKDDPLPSRSSRVRLAVRGGQQIQEASDPWITGDLILSSDFRIAR